MYNDIAKVCVIEIPRKINLPKVQSVYAPSSSYDDVNEGHFIFKQFGNAVFRCKAWEPGKRDDIIHYSNKDEATLSKLQICKNAPESAKSVICKLVTMYWDCFAEDGIKRPILGFEFAIDTGNHTPVCCKKPRYGPHESKVILKQVNVLLANEWITPCPHGGWGSPIVLAPKPHQEHVTDVDDLVWRMCVSYRGLNKVTNPFEYPIGRCDDAIEDVGDGVGHIYYIDLDSASGYHQVAVMKQDQPKLAFFAPDNEKYTFKVMPFGPRNAPPFFTCITKVIQTEATQLFLFLTNEVDVPLDSTISQQPDHFVSKLPRTNDYEKSCTSMTLPYLQLDPQYASSFRSSPITTNTTIIEKSPTTPVIRQRMRNSKQFHVTGSRVIIDDILLHSTSLSLLTLLFECYLRVYLKYRQSFRFKKCDFLSERFEFVGHDIMPCGNTTAASKYDLINDWKLPTTADGLHSFVSLINYYNRFCPLFEVRARPLRTLYTEHLHKKIPSTAWTPELKRLFESLKHDVTSSPVLARYDSSKPCFLKTDWSSRAMSFILMQPDNSSESSAALKKTIPYQDNNFETTLGGARLQPIASGCRLCTESESHHHSFIGEIGAGRWGIAQNKAFLWGVHFFWLCDMKSINHILEYDGPIHALRRWSQELMAYDFTPLHRPARLMQDVDALNRGPYHKIITNYDSMSHALHKKDQLMNALAYCKQTFEQEIQRGSYSIKKLRKLNHNAASDTALAIKLLDSTLPRQSEKRVKFDQHNAAHSSNDDTSIEYSNAQHHANALDNDTRTNYSDLSPRRDKPKKLKFTTTTSDATTCIAAPRSHISAVVAPRRDKDALLTASAKEDLQSTFATAISLVAMRNIPTAIYDVVHSYNMSQLYHLQHKICTSSQATIPQSVSRIITSITFQWVSIQPRLPTIAIHLMQRMGNCDVTVIQDTKTLSNLCQILCPHATIIRGNTKQFLSILRHDNSCSVPNQFRILPTVNEDMSNMPISHSEFRIDGIDFTLQEVFHIPFTTPLPSSLQQTIRIIHQLATSRNLHYFMIIATSVMPVYHHCDLVAPIAEYLPLWTISIQTVYCPDVGDPLAVHKLLIIGQLTMEHIIPEVTITRTTAENDISIKSCIDANNDISSNKIACVPQEALRIKTQSITQEAPLCLAVSNSSTTLNSNDIVLHPMHPGVEVAYNTVPEDPVNTFLIPYKISDQQCVCLRRICHSEMLSLYIGDITNIRSSLDQKIENLPSLLAGACPTNTADAIATFLAESYIEVAQPFHKLSHIRCCVNKQLPSRNEWDAAYASDKDTNYIISRVQDSTPWNESEIKKVHKGYWQYLRDGSITFKNGRLVLVGLNAISNRYLALIIVPTALRRTIFITFHASGVGAHMGAYKTLVVIRMRFFWPHMRTDILNWVKSCAQCIPARLKTRINSGLMHSWPIATPFAIISVDIWSPGDIKNCYGHSKLFNSMCDMTEFVICTAISNTEASYLARIFMEHVLLKFGLCLMVVCDDGNDFRGTFERMCKALNIKFHIVAKRNHKAVGVERFHKFLNHAEKISTEERGTSEPFVEVAMATAYAWNASPIEGTDIVRSIPAIGRELRYPLDVHLAETPTVIDNPSESVATYLRHLHRDTIFAKQLLAYLVEDRRTAHRERINEGRNLIKFKPGDFVMGRVAVQSKKSIQRVGKLVYQSKGPFVVVEDTGNDAYLVRRYGKPNGPLMKYMTQDLYLLPPTILPCEHMDTPDMRYLNSDFAPQNQPFGDLDIESYNTHWFENEPPSRVPTFIRDSFIPSVSPNSTRPLSENYQWNSINSEWTPRENTENLALPPVPPVQTIPQPVSPAPCLSPSPSPTPTEDSPIVSRLVESIAASKDKLFFIQYTPFGTLRPRWYAVQLEFQQCLPQRDSTMYLCEFLQRHPRDDGNADNDARWWPEWRKLSWNADGTFEYGERILYSPRAKPNLKNFSKFSVELDLTDDNVSLVGPFDFAPPAGAAKSSAIIPHDVWNQLLIKCEELSIVPPVLSASRVMTYATASTMRSKLKVPDIYGKEVSSQDILALELSQSFAL